MGKAAYKNQAVVRKSIKSFMELLDFAVSKNATHVHGVPDTPWSIRINGKLNKVESPSAPSAEDIKFIATYLSKIANKTLPTSPENYQCNFTIPFENDFKFSISLVHQGSSYAITLRRIPTQHRSLKDYKLEEHLTKVIASYGKVFLICNKSSKYRSDLANAFLESINRKRHAKIITLEENIKSVFKNIKSSVLQLELGTDVENIDIALEKITESDPDYLYIDNINDCDTLLKILEISDSTCPVLLGVDEENTFLAIEKIQNILSQSEHPMLSRHRIVKSVEGAIATKIINIPKKEGKVVFCYELMFINEAIKKHILRSGPLKSFVNLLEKNQSKTYPFMRSFDQHLEKLFKKGKISKSDMLIHASHTNFTSETQNPKQDNPEKEEIPIEERIKEDISEEISDQNQPENLKESPDGIIKDLQLNPVFLENLNVDENAPSPWEESSEETKKTNNKKKINDFNEFKRKSTLIKKKTS